MTIFESPIKIVIDVLSISMPPDKNSGAYGFAKGIEVLSIPRSCCPFAGNREKRRTWKAVP